MTLPNYARFFTTVLFVMASMATEALAQDQLGEAGTRLRDQIWQRVSEA